MPQNRDGRSFLKLLDFSPGELCFLLRLGASLKEAKAAGTEKKLLTGKAIALIFEKDSTRTRSAFEVAAHDQGAHVTCPGPTGSHIGTRATMKDTARVLSSPVPVAIPGIAPIRLLVEAGVCVICAGGGGIPVVRGPEGKKEGVEAVIDKDRTAALLARALDADVLLMLTDVAAVFRNWGGPEQAAIGTITPDALDMMTFPAGSMKPKITAACDFVRAGGTLAGLGRLQDARAIVDRHNGTQIHLAPIALENRSRRENNNGHLVGHQPQSVHGPV